MAQTLFFALKEDLLPIFQTVEKQGPLQYVLTGIFDSPNISSYFHGEEIPNLGKATCESAAACDTFLVCESDANVEVRRRNPDGTDGYFVDQLINPDALTFTSGGIWKPDILLYGRVASASDSATSKRLLRRFQTAIKKHFTRVGAYYVGAGALGMLKLGKRLTIAEQSPRDFDLKLSYLRINR